MGRNVGDWAGCPGTCDGRISQSPGIGRIFAAPGNAGIAEIADRLDVKVTDTRQLLDLTEKRRLT